MITYDLTNGDPHTLKIDYRPKTCFLMTQLGGTVPPEVDGMRRDLGSVLDTHGYTLIDANSTITGRDFLTKIWNMLISVPLAVAVVHEGMRPKTLWNVYYEIGVAQALGKETIIIKGQDISVPSDFVRTEYIEYDDDFKDKAGRFLAGIIDRARYYEDVAELLLENPLLAIDYLRRAYLINGRDDCRNKAKSILDSLSLEGRARNSVEMLLAEF